MKLAILAATTLAWLGITDTPVEVSGNVANVPGVATIERLPVYVAPDETTPTQRMAVEFSWRQFAGRAGTEDVTVWRNLDFETTHGLKIELKDGATIAMRPIPQVRVDTPQPDPTPNPIATAATLQAESPLAAGSDFRTTDTLGLTVWSDAPRGTWAVYRLPDGLLPDLYHVTLRWGPRYPAATIGCRYSINGGAWVFAPAPAVYYKTALGQTDIGKFALRGGDVIAIETTQLVRIDRIEVKP